jgi:hypothetical protein
LVHRKLEANDFLAYAHPYGDCRYNNCDISSHYNHHSVGPKCHKKEEECMFGIDDPAQPAPKPRSRGSKRDSRNMPAKVSRPVSHNTMARTKALLSAALRVWELKRRLPAD